MVLQRVQGIAEYLAVLRAKPDEVEVLFNDLLINVTSFFRDKTSFAVLAKKIFPKIIKTRAAEGGDIRIWVPGCSTGEEVYSLAITMLECLDKADSNLRVQIFGTDLSELAIAKARSGFYSDLALKEVSQERLRRFFCKTDQGQQISRNVRDLCTFARQNICEDPPFSRIDLL